jgi:ferrous iron transport protein B
MPICHDSPAAPDATAGVATAQPSGRSAGKPPAATLTLALAGNPNCGKTTLFNALTGLRQKVANYPGVTVEKKTGRCKLPATTGSSTAGIPALPERWADVIDLPGTYSLISRSPDEQVAMEVLRGLRPDTPPPDVLIAVVDASNLQRNLYLVSQLIELGRPMVVALNMTDVAERRGVKVSAAALSEQLGVPVVPLVGHKRKGVDDLKAAVARAAIPPLPAWPLPEAMREELLLVAGGLAILESETDAPASKDVATPNAESPSPNTQPPNSLTSAPQAGHSADRPEQPLAASRLTHFRRPLDRYEATAERLLIGDHAADVAPLADRPSVAKLLEGSRNRLAALGLDPMQTDIEAHYRWIDGVSAKVVSRAGDTAAGPASTATPDTSTPGSPNSAAAATSVGLPVVGTLPYASPRHPAPTATEKADAILIHRVWGLVIFAAVMAVLFVSIFWLASPLMDASKGAVTAVGGWVSAGMADGPLKSLVVDGVFAGVGAVVVFVPQIAMLFLFLAVLEDTGYLARAAFLMDRALGKVGLSGKAFIPLLSSFACAIPGIMATRTIENRRDRLATIFVAPFMSCSARLPVYFLLVGAFFAGYGALVRGGILFACYALGVLAAVGTAWVFKRSLLKGAPQAFILELPTYKVPQIGQVIRVVWTNTSKFLTKAGTVIFCLSVILWAMNYYPRLSEEKVAAAEVTGRHLASEDYRHRLIEGGDGETKGDETKFVESAVRAAQSEYSVAGRIGHAIEPVIRPLGFDWKMGVGLVSAFAAREVFVGSLGIVYSMGDVEDDTGGLEDAMRADRYADGRTVWTPLVAVSVLVWFVLAMQCMSTLAIVRRETGGWRWPVAMLVYMNALAYVACLVVFQVGSRIWGA